MAAGSHTESYAAIKLYIDNWRWKDVPFYLRTGKRLQERRSMVAVRFRQPPMQLFKGSGIYQPHPNWLLIGIQPEDAVRMEISAKVPGLEMHTRQIVMDASVSSAERAQGRSLRRIAAGCDQGRQFAVPALRRGEGGVDGG